jgi:hypothetical protein
MVKRVPKKTTAPQNVAESVAPAPKKKLSTIKKVGLAALGMAVTNYAFNRYMRNEYGGINFQVPLSSYPDVMYQAFRGRLDPLDVQQIMKMLSGRHPLARWDDQAF